jgi:hypothetical protein
VKDILIGIVVFAIISGGSLLGMLLGKILPDPHMSSESRDTIRTIMATLGTLSAVVLGLLTAHPSPRSPRKRVNYEVQE